MNEKASSLCEYLGRLLGRIVLPTDQVSLTSGQRARIAGWLNNHGVASKKFVKMLAYPFRVETLIGEIESAPLSDQPVSRQKPSRSTAVPAGSPSLRIGIDIQQIAELFDDHVERDPKASDELKRIFTLREISYAQSRPHFRETLAGLFAAKEALRKADASLLQQCLLDLEILPDLAGKPTFPSFEISISHSGGFAIAVAAGISNGSADGGEVTSIDQPAVSFTGIN